MLTATVILFCVFAAYGVISAVHDIAYFVFERLYK